MSWMREHLCYQNYWSKGVSINTDRTTTAQSVVCVCHRAVRSPGGYRSPLAWRPQARKAYAKCISPLIWVAHTERKVNIKKVSNALAMGPSRRTLKNLTEAWCLGPGPGHNGHQPADRTLRTPKLLCGRCAVCFYWDKIQSIRRRHSSWCSSVSSAFAQLISDS